MRTGKSLFENIAVMEAPATVVVRREGRNSQLIDERNKLIAARLYWYRNFSPYSYEIIKQKLEKEFFLAQITILELMQKDEYLQYLLELKNNKPAKNYFQDKWPHLRW